jgi:hypothetical protein
MRLFMMKNTWSRIHITYALQKNLWMAVRHNILAPDFRKMKIDCELY